MIKPKNALTQASTSSPDSPESLFLDYLSFVEDETQLLRKEYARRKLEAAKNVTQLIEKNKPTTKEEKEEQDKLASKEGGVLDIPLKKEEHLPTSSASASPQENNANEKLKQFLVAMAEGRRKNELIFGGKAGDLSQTGSRWGIEASKTTGCFRKNIDSTITREEAGWAEFAISYDNKIFLNYRGAEAPENHSFNFDHQTMGCGTFLKALGRIRIRGNHLTISPFSPYFEVGFSELPIILFVLKEKGVVISGRTIAIVDESGETLFPFYADRSFSGEEENPIAGFLDESRFPLAETIAKDKKLSIEKSLSDLFLGIDDKLLSTQNQALILRLLDKRASLKTDIISFLLSLVATHLKEFENEEQTLANNELLIQGYTKVSNQLQAFQQQGVDLQFVRNEIFSWFYYLSTLYFEAEAILERVADGEKEALAPLLELKALGASLQRIKETPSILAQRPILEQDGSISPLVKFYTNDPKETLIEVLMPHYTKGSAFKRLITLAWRRHYVEPVDKFLVRYNSGFFPDNLTINNIYQFIYGTQSHINECPNIKGLLIRYIKFCAKLNNEMDDRAELDLTAISSLVAETVQREREDVIAATASAIVATTEYTPLVAELDPQGRQAVSSVATTSVIAEVRGSLVGLGLRASNESIKTDEALEKDLGEQVGFFDKHSSITSDDKGSIKFFKATPSSQESLTSQESLSQEAQGSSKVASPVPSSP
jgi:hypothetical protein